jgi:hypothetical protein
MIGADDLSSPPSARVANLTLAVGIGALGEQVIAELRKLLVTSEDGHRWAVASWCSADQGTHAAEAAALLLSNRNLDTLEQAGYQVPGRDVGQPPRLSVAYIVDLNDQGSSQSVDTVRKDLESVCVPTTQSIIAAGAGQIAEILASDTVARYKWDFVVPISSQDRVAGARAQIDIVATVARIVFVFSVADQPHFGSRVLGRTATPAVPGTPVVRIGGAFLDSGRGELLMSLSGFVACGLLGRQFENLASFQPAGAFDDQRRTKLLDLVGAEVLGRRLLGDTPFELRIDDGGVWHVELPRGIVAAELHRVPRRRWIAVLQKLRDLFDFTKARRWAESVERSEAAMLSSIQEAITEDIRQLHHYERGPDRLLSWASAARDLLEVQPEIVRPANADIDAAIGRLRAEVLRSPNSIAVWVRVVLLGCIGAEGIRHIFRALFGDMIGWLGFTSTLIVAAILGFRLLERAHQDLHSALKTAQEALIRRYEAQMRENLSLVLTRVRSRLMALLDNEISKVQNQVQCASDITGSMIGEFGGTTATDLVNVEWIVPAESRQRLLESLNLPWSTLQRQAAANGVFVPDPPEGTECIRQTVAAAVDFSMQYLQSRLDDFGLQGLMEFRCNEDLGFEDRIVRDLDRRSTALAGRAPLRTSWHGPADVLTQLHDKIVTLDPDAVEQPSVSGMVACLKVGGSVTVLPGDPK